jgi:TolB-like protein/DNA-binding winged helix-turn-helix (wHTH) protein/tetratricopeptide (TPR) repeat protein
VEQSTGAVRGYRFGVFVLDLASGELRRRDVKVRLRGRPIEILVLLLGRRGELVTRDELRAALWSADTFVDFDHGLNSAMNKLRDALGDPAERSRFIQTEPKRGYRFVGQVEVLAGTVTVPSVAEGARSLSSIRSVAETGPAPNGSNPPVSVLPPTPVPVSDPEPPALPPVAPTVPARTRPRAAWLSPLAVVLLVALVTAVGVGGVLWSRRPARGPVASRRVMLAVLPFENLSGGPDQDYFSDGITDDTIAQLGALDAARLGVIARTTSMQYKRTSKSAMEIGRELRVDYLLEGSVRRDAERVRINAQLVDVNSQTQLWTETFDHELKDVLLLEHDVAMRLARSLAVGVLSPVLGQPAPATPKFAAYELVLRARSLRNQATESSAWRCVATFEESIAIDPTYAPAHSGLADCYRLLGAPGWEAGPPAELLERARVAAERAMTLDPQLAEASAVRAMVRFNKDWDLEGALRDVDHAIALNPSLARAHQYRSAVLMVMGKFPDAVEAARRAQQLDPLSAAENTTLGVRLYYAGRYKEAVEQFTHAIEITPEFAVAHWGLGETHLQEGRTTEATAELRRAVTLSQDSAYMRAWLAHALASAGQQEEARTIRRDLEHLASERYVSPFLFALIAAGSRDQDETLAWLQRTAAAGSGWIPFLPVEPEFAWLRKAPGFFDIIANPRARAGTSPHPAAGR